MCNKWGNPLTRLQLQGKLNLEYHHSSKCTAPIRVLRNPCVFAPRKASFFKAALVSNQLLWDHHMLQSTLILTAYIHWHFLWYTKKVAWFVACHFLELMSQRENVQERVNHWQGWQAGCEKKNGKEERSCRRLTVVEYADSFLQVTLSVIGLLTKCMTAEHVTWKLLNHVHQ